MKLLNSILALTLLLALASCSSGNKSAEDESGDLATSSEDADFVVDSDDDSALVDEAPASEEVASDNSTPPKDAERAPGSEEEMAAATETTTPSRAPAVALGEDFGEYTVASNDTLMLIAFKVYGDYSMWKQIQNDNNGISSTKLTVGSVIKYKKPQEEFVWGPRGNPWLIKLGDTLGIISKDVYGATTKWRDIYNNNRPMIKDPNLIFAGFTLYYVPTRDIASEQQ